MATTAKTEIQPDVSKMPDYVRDSLYAAVMDLFWSYQNAKEKPQSTVDELASKSNATVKT